MSTAVKCSRGQNFSAAERETLVGIIEKNSEIVENKKTDSLSSKLKDAAWVAIAEEFSSMPEGATKRSAVQLKLWWQNQKKRARKQIADSKASVCLSMSLLCTSTGMLPDMSSTLWILQFFCNN
jgi:Myb/SANT-like DNA-binding domain